MNTTKEKTAEHTRNIKMGSEFHGRSRASTNQQKYDSFAKTLYKQH